MASERIVAISAARLIAMLMIITCHILQYYHLELAWWFNVGVQIFLIISGFLSGTLEISNPIDWLKRRFFRVLIPFYSLLLIYLILCKIFTIELSVVEVLKSVFTLGNLPGLQHLWFVSHILFCYVITPYLYELGKKFNGNIIIIGLLLCIYIIISSIINAHFSHHIICCYILGFYLGYIYGKSSSKGILMSRIALFVSLIAALLNVARIILKYVYPEWMTYVPSRLWVAYSNYSHVLLGAALFTILFKLFHNAKYNCLLEISDKYSYEIYLTHHLLILSPFSVMSCVNSPYINIIIVLVGTVLLSVILKKIAMFIEISLMPKK